MPLRLFTFRECKHSVFYILDKRVFSVVITVYTVVFVLNFMKHQSFENINGGVAIDGPPKGFAKGLV
jgi:hypothetical protein